ncbi:MAG: hypothetical protein R2712_26450 [Vicinamibacterales bacterium]
MPKNGPVKSVEDLGRGLIRAARDLFEDDRLGHGHELEVVVPVVVTNATLHYAVVAAEAVDLATGAAN